MMSHRILYINVRKANYGNLLGARPGTWSRRTPWARLFGGKRKGVDAKSISVERQRQSARSTRAHTLYALAHSPLHTAQTPPRPHKRTGLLIADDEPDVLLAVVLRHLLERVLLGRL